MLSEITNAEFEIKLGNSVMKGRSLSIGDLAKLETHIKGLVKKEFQDELDFMKESLSAEDIKARRKEVYDELKAISVGSPTFDRYMQTIESIVYILYLSINKVTPIKPEDIENVVCLVDFIDENERGFKPLLVRILGFPEGFLEKKAKAVEEVPTPAVEKKE